MFKKQLVSLRFEIDALVFMFLEDKIVFPFTFSLTPFSLYWQSDVACAVHMGGSEDTMRTILCLSDDYTEHSGEERGKMNHCMNFSLNTIVISAARARIIGNFALRHTVQKLTFYTESKI